uniref:MFS domain-containing protein n=1 Tax=Steinernema glaseri TaxID=37863 RepID=A0A1I7Y9J9_9BILA
MTQQEAPFVMHIKENASTYVHMLLRDGFMFSGMPNYTNAIEEEERPTLMATWGVGMAIISISAFSAPMGMMLVPLLSKSVYERFMTFLVALGIGAMSGSCIFIMIPQAFNIDDINTIDYTTKSWIILSALYGFFTVDRILQFILELRRRYQTKPKARKPAIAVLSSPAGERRRSQIKHMLAHEQDEIKHQIQDAMINNALVRTFSHRRKVAVCGNAGPLSAAKHFDEKSTVSDLDSRSLNLSNFDKSMEDLSTMDEPKSHTFTHGDKLQVPRSDYQLKPLENGKKKESNMDEPKSHTFTHGDKLQVPRSDYQLKPLENGKKKESHVQVIEPTSSSDPEAVVPERSADKKVIDPAEIEVASVAYMIIFGSSANNFVDGMSTGAAFSDSVVRGVSIGLAVVSQQFPQELGTLAILINSGLGFKKTMLFNLVPIVLSYAGFAVGVFLDNVNEAFDDLIFAVSSGMYLYIFLGTLIPEVRESFNEILKDSLAEAVLTTLLQACGITFSIFFMYYMSCYGDEDSLKDLV